MLHTQLCDLLDIEYPLIQAGMGPFTNAELVAAVSNAGGLGSLGGSRPLSELKEHLTRLKELTDRPFAVNFTWVFLHSARTTFAEEAISTVLEARPRVLSLALGEPGDLVNRAHDAGILFMQQVHTVEQARHAAGLGVDIIVAQGSEAGGFIGSNISAMPLIPQVVDAVDSIPVVAAGGIADGRGLAAALVLGAQGVNMGTRFLASTEAGVSNDWKEAILRAGSEDVVKLEVWGDIFPEPQAPGSYHTLPRALSTPFSEQWQQHRDEATGEAARLREDVDTAVRENRMHERVPFTGQTTGLIHDVLPAAEILSRIVAEAEKALRRAGNLIV
jgi:enoyl-[acyl-carrier protein] reductase II